DKLSCGGSVRRRHCLAALGLWHCFTLAAAPLQNAPAQFRAALDQYCVTCHNQRLKTAGLTLDTLDVAKPASQAEVWEKVVLKLRAGTMPPAGARRPDAATYHALASWLEGQLDQVAEAAPDPGRPALHRLNRSEYANAIRDLLALDIDASSLLPPDDSAF